MVEISFGFDVVGTQYVDFKIEDFELEEIGWDEMSDAEKVIFLRENYEDRAYQEALSLCEFDLGGLFNIQENGEEIYS